MADMIENGMARGHDPIEGLFNPKRYERIGNVTFMMAPASRKHERIVGRVYRQLGDYLEGKPCEVYTSNIGLDLKEFIPDIKELTSFQSYFKKNIEKGKEEEVYFLPDISVLCDVDDTKFSSHGYKGVPKMLIEVTSLSTASRDFEEKRSMYEAIGVPEYWVISNAQNVTVYVLHDNKFVKTIYETEENILEVPVSVFPDLVIKFDKNKMELPT